MGGGRKTITSLNVAVQAWPTPAAHEARLGYQDRTRGMKGTQVSLSTVAMDWKTPRVAVGAYTRDRGQPGSERPTLEGQAAQWSTPRASDAQKGGPNQSFGAGETPLPSQAAHWQTPSVGMVSGGQTSRSGDRKDEILINGQAEMVSRSARPDPATSRDGEPSSPPRRSLNPLFVEWLMGWPPGWTSFACSATAFTRWQQRMRCELSRLELKPAAPVQQSLL